MQFGSPSARLTLAPGRLWGRARSSMGGGVLWSALLVFLLAYAIATSPATAAWVPGIGVIPLIALGAALLMAVLAVLPVPWPAALRPGGILGPVGAVSQARASVHPQRPLDVVNSGLIGVWWTRITDGRAWSDPSFYLFMICWLMWVTGAWLSWCVVRWPKPM